MTDKSKKTLPIAGISMTEDAGGGDKVLEAPNPFDPERLALKGNPAEAIGVKKMLVTVPVRKPSKQEWFRVHPDPAYRRQMAILELRTERETYVVTPEVAAAIPDEIKPCMVTTCITRQGVVLLWPVPLPREEGRELAWHLTAREAAEQAQSKWIRMSANMSLGAYDLHEARSEIPDPNWPDHTFMKLLEVAFGNGHLIASEDHPVLKQLLGQA